MGLRQLDNQENTFANSPAQSIPQSITHLPRKNMVKKVSRSNKKHPQTKYKSPSHKNWEGLHFSRTQCKTLQQSHYCSKVKLTRQAELVMTPNLSKHRIDT